MSTALSADDARFLRSGAAAGELNAVWPEGHVARLEESRRVLLGSIGTGEAVTLVRSVGNLGDQLILAGTRRLLAGLPDNYREIGLDQVDSASGDTAVLAGGGAWCVPYHELLPRALALVETRFARVIILPSSFDVSVPVVKRALSSTRALVFARERTSFQQIQSLCDARLAHDGAFFFDFLPYRCRAEGVLNAHRTDRESASRFPLAPDNRDISLTCTSLDEWLWTIARHALIRTDRAHVMIAGALLGRSVEYRPSAYHKVPALAEWALAGFPVRPEAEDSAARPTTPALPIAVAEASAALHDTPEIVGHRARIESAARAADPEDGQLAADGAERTTIVLVTRNRPKHVLNAIRSIRQSSPRPYRILVIDNGDSPDVCDEIEAATARDLETDFLSLETNLGCAGGRQYAIDLVTTDYVLFLDDDAEVFPRTIDRLVDDLDRHPDVFATGARVVLPNGRMQLCGGRLSEQDGLLRFDPLDAGRPAEDAIASGPCDWVPGTAFMVRRSALARYPLDTEMGAYYEDNEWCYRVRGSRRAAFRRCAEAFVLHHQVPKHRSSSEPQELARVMPYIRSIARLYQVHGRVLDAIFGMVPELGSGENPGDREAAREFLDVILAKGSEWVLDHWLRGELALLIQGDLGLPRRCQESELHRIRTSRLWRLANLYWSARRRLSRLARLPRAR